MGRRLGILWALTLLICLGLGQSQQAAAAEGAPRAGNTLAGMQFAFADLDGDRKPDLALVEVESERASSTNYAIRLQFSGGPGSSIGVRAPSGGLRLAVRDVNGDDSLDLILTSAIDRHVIQVLVNDGHGQFAAAEAGSFSSSEDGGEFGWGDREQGPSDRMVLVGGRTFFGAEVVSPQIVFLSNQYFDVVSRNDVFVAWREAGSKFGRSPPSVLIVF